MVVDDAVVAAACGCGQADPVVIHTVFDLARNLHDSVDSLSLAHERHQIAALICSFIQKVCTSDATASCSDEEERRFAPNSGHKTRLASDGGSAFAGRWTSDVTSTAPIQRRRFAPNSGEKTRRTSDSGSACAGRWTSDVTSSSSSTSTSTAALASPTSTSSTSASCSQQQHWR